MSQQTERNILEQGRAEFAYQCAKRASGNDYLKEEYRSLAKKLPMLIKTNGLGAAMAFFFSKSKNGKMYRELFNEWSNIKDNAKIYKEFFQKQSNDGVYKIIWQCAEEKKQFNKQNAHEIIIDCIQKNRIAHYEVYRDILEWIDNNNNKKFEKELMEEIINLNSSEYRAITIEILSFLNWLKRFADGLIQKEENESHGEG